MITTRILERSEWGKLSQTWWKNDLASLEQLDADVLVAERDGALVAVWPIALMLHADGCEIVPGERKNPAVARALLDGLKAQIRRRGASFVLMGSETPDVEGMLARMGTEVPGKTFAVAV